MVLRGDSWLSTQGSTPGGSQGTIWIAGNLTRSYMQGNHPTCCAIAPAPDWGILTVGYEFLGV